MIDPPRASPSALYSHLRMRFTDSVEWWSDIGATLRDALAASDDRRIEALAAAQREVFGPGTFLGDYLCVVSRLRLPAEHAEALLRLSTRLLGTDDVSAQAAVLFAISSARDAEPQEVRLGKLWVLDPDGLKLKFVPIHYWRLDDVDEFEVYLAQIAKLERAIDVRDVRDGIFAPRIVGPKSPVAHIDIELLCIPEVDGRQILKEISVSPYEIIASTEILRKLLGPLLAWERKLIDLLCEQAHNDEI